MHIHNFVLFCKTYSGDLDRFKILKSSVDKFNVEKVPFFISCPRADRDLFLSLKDNSEKYEYTVLTDEEILAVGGQEKFECDYVTQQLVKLSFYKMHLCNNYLVVDSDSYFIRNFYEKEFMFDEQTPYFFVHEQNNRKVLYDFLDEKCIDWGRKIIKEFFGREGKNYFMPLCGNLLLSVKALQEFEHVAREQWDKTFADLLNISPFEFIWYSEFVFNYKPHSIIPYEPLFLDFDYQIEYDIFRNLGITEDDIAKKYAGIVMQNGWVGDKRYKPIKMRKLKKNFLRFKHYLYKDRRGFDKNWPIQRKIRFYIKYSIVSLLKKVF